jgi:hypothetical protein
MDFGQVDVVVSLNGLTAANGDDGHVRGEGFSTLERRENLASHTVQTDEHCTEFETVNHLEPRVTARNPRADGTKPAGRPE